MSVKLLLLLLFAQINLLNASDLRVVPSLWRSNSSEESIDSRASNHDRVVPQVHLSPLGVHHDEPIITERESKDLEKFPKIVDSDENVIVDKVEDSKTYPTPRPRIQEDDNETKTIGSDPPTPRPRIVEVSKEKFDSSERSIRSSSEDEDKFGKVSQENETTLHDDPKPFAFVYRARPIELDDGLSESNSIEGQPEEILIIQDVSSTEETDDLGSKEKSNEQEEVSDEEIQKYIDQIDREFKEKNAQKTENKDDDLNSGSKKIFVTDYERPKFRREAVKPIAPQSHPLKSDNDKLPSNNINNANKPSTDTKAAPPSNDKASVPPVDGAKITNEQKSAGGLSYNIGFEEAKAPKPALSPRTKRDAYRPFQISDQPREANKTFWSHPATDSSSESESSSSEELTQPDKQLPQNDQKTFEEVLHKTMKDHQNKPSEDDTKIHTQEVQRLPHKGPTIKNDFLAVDPPMSNESSENATDEEDGGEIGVLVVEKTIVLDDTDENKTQNVFIEDSDVKINVINVNDEEMEEKKSFWQNGFTIALHVSPLSLCLFTALILAGLLMRLALKIHKKRLESSAAQKPTSSNLGKNKHEFDDVSLQTVSTN